MFDWSRFTLFLFILMRMSGFVLFNPILGRRGLPGIVRASFVLVLTLAVAAATPGGVTVPTHLLDLILRLLLELLLGYLLAFVMQLFFYIPAMAGEVVDMQLGFSMGKTYDPGSQTSLSVTASFINVFMYLLFFAAGGHHTLMRIMLTSGDIVPFGAARLGASVPEALVQLFISCTLLAIKLALPILAAELMGQIGMGILMKAIPQINIFAINIELKVIIGLALLMVLIAPFSQFLLAAENQMLGALSQMLRLSS